MARVTKSEFIGELAQRATISFGNAKDFFETIDQERRTALSYYMQLSQGNEAQGFSEYITSDVRDTVKWTLAQLMDMFYTGDAPVRFVPRNENDVDQADIETEYVNYVIKEQNEGFLTINTWFQDALVQKNGVVKVFWDDTVAQKPENYESKTYQDYAMLLNEKDYTVKNVRVYSKFFDDTFTEEEFTAKLNSQDDPIMGMAAIQEARFDIKGFRKADLRQVRVENCQPENFFVDRTWASLSLEGCPYAGYRTYPTRAQLLEQGFDYDDVMALPVADITSDNNFIGATRYVKDNARNQGNHSSNPASQYVEFIEHYMVDISAKTPKMWCLKTGSNGSVVFDYYEVDRFPFHVITPSINPYRFFGDSVADELIDIQYHRSNLFRAAFDNIKYTVAPQRLVKGDVNIDELEDVSPLKTVTSPSGTGDVQILTTPFVADSALKFASVLEQQRAERTGFSRETAGLDPAALANSTNAIGGAILNMSQTRVKMIASTFASTGYKSMCEHVRELLMKYEDRDILFEVSGKYITMSPRSWFQSRSTSVRAGLGTAGRSEMQYALQGILALQEKISVAQGGFMGPLVNLNNVYNAVRRNLESFGIKDTESFFTNPEGYQPPAPQPTPTELQLESFERTERYKVDVNADVKVKEMNLNAQTDIYKINQESLTKERELAYKYQEGKANELDKASEALAAKATVIRVE